MFEPGEDVPDPTEGIVDVQDLPLPIFVPYEANYAPRPYPRCGHLADRHKCDQRTLHDGGDVRAGRPVALVVPSSSPSCSHCRQHCHVDLSDLAWSGSHYTRRGIDLAVRSVVEDGVPSRPASWH